MTQENDNLNPKEREGQQDSAFAKAFDKLKSVIGGAAAPKDDLSDSDNLKDEPKDTVAPGDEGKKESEGSGQDQELEQKVELLVSAGFSEEEISELADDPDKLDAAVKVATKLLKDREEESEDDEDYVDDGGDEEEVEEEETEDMDAIAQELMKAAEALDDDTKAVVGKLAEFLDKKYQKQINDLKEALTTIVSGVQRQEAVNVFNQANKWFDLKAAELPELGKFEELPRKNGQLDTSSPQFKAREAIFNKAAVLMQAGQSLYDALEDAYAWYIGKHGKAAVTKQIITKLKERASKASLPSKSLKTDKTGSEVAMEKLARAIKELK